MSDILTTLGTDWLNIPPDNEHLGKRIQERARKIPDSDARFRRDLREYVRGGFSVLDISCGTGIDLEVMRYYGNQVHGMEIQYFEFMESQGISATKHSGHELPYPFEDDSFDLVMNIGAISCYDRPWTHVIGEFFRIARKHVYFIANKGPVFDANQHMVPGNVPGWEIVMRTPGLYKWKKR